MLPFCIMLREKSMSLYYEAWRTEVCQYKHWVLENMDHLVAISYIWSFKTTPFWLNYFYLFYNHTFRFMFSLLDPLMVWMHCRLPLMLLYNYLLHPTFSALELLPHQSFAVHLNCVRSQSTLVPYVGERVIYMTFTVAALVPFLDVCWWHHATNHPPSHYFPVVFV